MSVLSRASRSIFLALGAYHLYYGYSALTMPAPLAAGAEFTLGQFIADQYGGRWKYLTILSLTGAFWTLAISSINALIQLSSLEYIRSVLMSLFLPAEAIVSILYWTLVFIDPSLLNPSPKGKQDMYLPLWLDLSMHFAPFVYLFVDYILFGPSLGSVVDTSQIQTNKTRVLQVAPFLLSISMLYVFWIEHCSRVIAHHKLTREPSPIALAFPDVTNNFPYPFLDTMALSQRAVFYFIVFLLMLGVWTTLDTVYRTIYSPAKTVKAE